MRHVTEKLDALQYIQGGPKSKPLSTIIIKWY